MVNCEGCKHEAECREQVCLYDFYEKGKADKAKEIYDAMYEMLWECDIPSPTVPEYVEHHQQIQNLMISLKQICGIRENNNG